MERKHSEGRLWWDIKIKRGHEVLKHDGWNCMLMSWPISMITCYPWPCVAWYKLLQSAQIHSKLTWQAGIKNSSKAWHKFYVSHNENCFYCYCSSGAYEGCPWPWLYLNEMFESIDEFFFFFNFSVYFQHRVDILAGHRRKTCSIQEGRGLSSYTVTSWNIDIFYDGLLELWKPHPIQSYWSSWCLYSCLTESPSGVY